MQNGKPPAIPRIDARWIGQNEADAGMRWTLTLSRDATGKAQTYWQPVVMAALGSPSA